LVQTFHHVFPSFKVFSNVQVVAENSTSRTLHPFLIFIGIIMVFLLNTVSGILYCVRGGMVARILGSEVIAATGDLLPEIFLALNFFSICAVVIGTKKLQNQEHATNVSILLYGLIVIALAAFLLRIYVEPTTTAYMCNEMFVITPFRNLIKIYLVILFMLLLFLLNYEYRYKGLSTPYKVQLMLGFLFVISIYLSTSVSMYISLSLATAFIGGVRLMFNYISETYQSTKIVVDNRVDSRNKLITEDLLNLTLKVITPLALVLFFLEFWLSKQFLANALALTAIIDIRVIAGIACILPNLFFIFHVLIFLMINVFSWSIRNSIERRTIVWLIIAILSFCSHTLRFLLSNGSRYEIFKGLLIVDNISFFSQSVVMMGLCSALMFLTFRSKTETFKKALPQALVVIIFVLLLIIVQAYSYPLIGGLMLSVSLLFIVLYYSLGKRYSMKTLIGLIILIISAVMIFIFAVRYSVFI
jgi:hypothetical protein